MILVALGVVIMIAASITIVNEVIKMAHILINKD